MSDLSNRIIRLIEENGLSYGELAELTGIPKSALQRYATGETEKIPLPRIATIAKALGVSSAYLIGWDTGEQSANEKQPSVSEGLSEEELTLIEAFRALPPDERKHVLSLLRLAASKGQAAPASDAK